MGGVGLSGGGEGEGERGGGEEMVREMVRKRQRGGERGREGQSRRVRTGGPPARRISPAHLHMRDRVRVCGISREAEQRMCGRDR